MCVVLTLANVGGFMHFWGLTIDTVSCTNLIISIGGHHNVLNNPQGGQNAGKDPDPFRIKMLRNDVLTKQYTFFSQIFQRVDIDLLSSRMNYAWAAVCTNLEILTRPRGKIQANVTTRSEV
jgi:hypothetical protein